MPRKHMNGPFEGKYGLCVEVRNNNIDGAIKLLGRKIKSEGLLREIRRREYYEKPSVIRRRKRSEGIARHRKAEARKSES